ncbi:Cysteine-rich secretory protein family protein [Marinilabilia salmonicolor]|jgi:uncharacterized protein YkwD|uniref:CAP domain-containing protein n=1 Tax=Marinilabilia salmonicolor TaxID=989 RepID=UPI000D077C15|nr:CAP domain-containing protein [Marinilabilia salmonicolor]PRZ01696.1 Cysteine-rich secretory protein family protein [Marinilabilia salmonicolor]
MQKIFISLLFFSFGLFGTAQTPDYSDVEFDKQQMLELVNNARMTKRRCGGKKHDAVAPLQWNRKLAQAAQKHADDMGDNDFFDHTGSDKSTVVVRVEREEYLWRAVGENVAMGPRSVSEAVKGWLDSPGHCSNIMSDGFTEMGAALSNNGQYWVQVFGAPRGE